MHKTRVVLQLLATPVTQGHQGTHIRRRILIVLTRLHPIRLITTKQQRAAVPSRSEARDDSVDFCVASGRERAGRVTKDVGGCRSGEGDVVGEGEGVVADLAGHVAEGGLGVDRKLVRGVLGEDWEGV